MFITMMLDIKQDIHSLTDFKRHTAEYLRQLKASQRPLVLTVNGKAELVVQDAAAYQKLLELVDRLEAIEGIQRGLDEMAAGRGRPADGFFAELKAKYGSSADE